MTIRRGPFRLPLPGLLSAVVCAAVVMCVLL
jgi:hypothetical protein